MAHRLNDVASSRLTLGAHHCGTLVDSSKRFTKILAATDERHLEAVLVEVVAIVGGGEHFGLVNVVNIKCLKDARLALVTDACLCHDRDRHSGLDPLDHVGVAHAGYSTVATNVRRDALQCHNGNGTGLLGDLRLSRGDDVHDHAALEHLGEAALRGPGRRLGALWCWHDPILAYRPTRRGLNGGAIVADPLLRSRSYEQ